MGFSDVENVLSSGAELFWYTTFSTLMCVMVRPFVMSLTSFISPPLKLNSKLKTLNTEPWILSLVPYILNV